MCFLMQAEEQVDRKNRVDVVLRGGVWIEVEWNWIGTRGWMIGIEIRTCEVFDAVKLDRTEMRKWGNLENNLGVEKSKKGFCNHD